MWTVVNEAVNEIQSMLSNRRAMWTDWHSGLATRRISTERASTEQFPSPTGAVSFTLQKNNAISLLIILVRKKVVFNYMYLERRMLSVSA